jgi:hypothetical protein
MRLGDRLCFRPRCHGFAVGCFPFSFTGAFPNLVGGPGVIMAVDSLAGRGFDRAHLHSFAGRNQDNRVKPPRIVVGEFNDFLGRLTRILDAVEAGIQSSCPVAWCVRTDRS